MPITDSSAAAKSSMPTCHCAKHQHCMISLGNNVTVSSVSCWIHLTNFKFIPCNALYSQLWNRATSPYLLFSYKVKIWKAIFCICTIYIHPSLIICMSNLCNQQWHWNINFTTAAEKAIILVGMWRSSNSNLTMFELQTFSPDSKFEVLSALLLNANSSKNPCSTTDFICTDRQNIVLVYATRIIMHNVSGIAVDTLLVG